MIAPAVAYVAACGLSYRLRGRGIFWGAKTLNGFVFALPVLWFATEWLHLALYLATAVGCKYAMQMGHGSYFDLGRVSLEDDETIEPLLAKLFDPGYAYDAAGMVVTGILGIAPLAVGLTVLFGNPLFLLIALAGAVKWPSYELAWRVFEKPIAMAEAIFGTTCGALVVLLMHGVL